MPSSRTTATFSSPIVASRSWIEGLSFPKDRPLLNLSQAAPADPPPLLLRQAMADAALNETEAHLYGAVLGRDDLRQALAEQMSQHYNAQIRQEQIGITSGCNQAFAAAIASLCSEGDEVILPVPWYFNHKMWLDLSGVKTVPLEVDDRMYPSINAAAALITGRTKAIALVSPNNPTGAEYPAELLEGFAELCKAHGLTLILDETYRDFDSRATPPHNLFQDPDWDQWLIHLYSFSKAYRLTGHRIGALACSTSRLFEIEKFLDTVTICPSQLGQIGALWGIENLQDWLAGERTEILARKQAIQEGFPQLEEYGWKLLECGAYFAYVEHPFDSSSDSIAKELVSQASVLMLPGSMFMPADHPDGHRQFRIAFANVDPVGIAELFNRLAAFSKSYK